MGPKVVFHSVSALILQFNKHGSACQIVLIISTSKLCQENVFLTALLTQFQHIFMRPIQQVHNA